MIIINYYELHQIAIDTKETMNGEMKGFFTFLVEHADKLSHKQLTAVARELDYATHSNVDFDTYNNIIDETLTALEDDEVFN